jgi:DNA adenine methylase
MIENRPALELLAQHDSEDTLFFIDPPYLLDTRQMQRGQHGYYRHEMSNAQHVDLLQALQKVKGMVVLSGYPSALYDQHLDGWTRHTTTARIAAGRGAGIRQECAWLNPLCAAALAAQDTALFSRHSM